MNADIHIGDCRDVLASLPAGSVHCCVTSPPYFGLRDYGVTGQLGLEPTLEDYVETMVGVFREVRRVLSGKKPGAKFAKRWRRHVGDDLVAAWRGYRAWEIEDERRAKR